MQEPSDHLRFDLYATLIEYMQSRGRARHEKSTVVMHASKTGRISLADQSLQFVHMIESGNSRHMEDKANVENSEASLEQNMICTGCSLLLGNNALFLRVSAFR